MEQATEAPPAALPRKGARRMAEIPPEVLADLNAGQLPTANLVEWLAVDLAALARNVFRSLGERRLAERVGREADAAASLGVTARLSTLGRAIHHNLADTVDGPRLFDLLAAHPSDVVRSWACSAIEADGSMPLDERLAKTRRFAVDDHFSVRETAWMCVRPYYAATLDKTLQLLAPWVADEDANARRFAIESTRPRGVWCAHLTALKQRPEQAAHLLERVRADDARYVQTSVANWLNDASKTQAAWVERICRRWLRESKTPATAWIVDRALRTIRRA